MEEENEEEELDIIEEELPIIEDAIEGEELGMRVGVSLKDGLIKSCNIPVNDERGENVIASPLGEEEPTRGEVFFAGEELDDVDVGPAVEDIEEDSCCCRR